MRPRAGFGHAGRVVKRAADDEFGIAAGKSQTQSQARADSTLVLPNRGAAHHATVQEGIRTVLGQVL